MEKGIYIMLRVIKKFSVGNIYPIIVCGKCDI